MRKSDYVTTRPGGNGGWFTGSKFLVTLLSPLHRPQSAASAWTTFLHRLPPSPMRLPAVAAQGPRSPLQRQTPPHRRLPCGCHAHRRDLQQAGHVAHSPSALRPTLSSKFSGSVRRLWERFNLPCWINRGATT
ncbi:hypothetical protein GWK47_053203 [Chionoecetes opilio]|uniref:Uncharacterized protein n=1 Tax=Chionoecetes opilio TaxID=41210 RepID=A0A8J5CSD8_CHIOP|nr:hypothetical protein GWK47_053203 [Chionoecetes opilio]